MSSLRDLNDIPAKYRSIFSPIHQFNRVQSDIFHDVFRTKKHIVVSAPTGSGKTAIFELAIVNLLMSLEQTNCNTDSIKIIYVAPTKALCNEIFQKWQEKFSAPAIALKVALVTGDSDPTEMSDLIDLAPYQIAVTTPEKWDAMTRKWKEHTEIANAVRLVLIDEVHLVGDTSRGPTLEAIVSRIKTFPQNHNNNGQIRFISVSASLPNIEDVAKWIGAGQTNDGVCTFKIEENQRPVKLTRHVIGVTPQANSFLMNIYLTKELVRVLNEILAKLSAEKQILIFCPTRNDVESTLDRLLNEGHLLGKLQLNETQRAILIDLYSRIKDDKLRRGIASRLAFHHAGLSYEDREHIENAYRNGAIKILLSTNTLATGVNLPAHTVIIKSTEHYVNGATQEISDSTILQMMGRAGRQQYNSTGSVYIMTSADKKEFYEKLEVGTVPIESHLNKKLAEFLNAEIALNTVTDCDASVMQWLRTTFLYVRTTTTTNRLTTTKHLTGEAELKDLCKRAINDLQRSKTVAQKPDGSLSTLPFGVVMAKYFLSIPTIVAFQQLRGTESIFNILDKIVYCNEFTDIYVRKNEKKLLNDLNQNIRFPTPLAAQTVPQKVSCLLQAFLGNISIDNSALLVDQRRVVQIAEQLTSSLIEFFQTSQFTDKCFNAMVSSTILIKSLRTKTWSDRNVFGELNISKADADKLIQSDINSVDDLMKTNPREIEDILHKEIPFGNELIDEAAEKFPCYEVNVDVMADRVIKVRVAQTNFQYTCQPTTIDTGLTLLIGDSCNNLICYEDIQPALNDCGRVEKLLTLESEATAVYIHVIHHKLVGADKMVKYSLRESTAEDDVLKIMERISAEREIPKKNISPVKIPTENVLSKKSKGIRKSFVLKTPSVKSAKSVGKQLTLSQCFKSNTSRSSDQGMITPKIPSAFDSKNRVLAPKVLTISPDLFPTQIEPTQRPEDLYNFNYLQSSNVSPPKQLDTNDVRINQTENVKQTPCLAETPIKSKIRQQRNEQDGLMNDFVRANAICKKDIVNDSIDEKSPDNLPKPSSNQRKNRKWVSDIESLFGNGDEDDDNDCLQAIENFDEKNPSNPQTKSHSLADAPKHKTDRNESIQSILNVDREISVPEDIRFDFDDDDEWLNLVESPSQMRQQNEYDVNDLPSDFWSNFNSDDSTSNLIDLDTKSNEPPAKQMALENVVGEKTATVLRVSPAKQRAIAPNEQQPCTSALNASPFSTSSNRAMCGSPKQNWSSSVSKSQQSSISRMNVSQFAYQPPPQMSANTSRPTNMKRSANYAESEQSQPKKSSLIDDLVKNGEKNRSEYGRVVNSLRTGNVKQQTVGKASSKTVFSRITRNDLKPDFDADAALKKCQERLKTDATYKKHDYDIDYCRLKILKLGPSNSAPQPTDTDTTFSDTNDAVTHVSFDENTYRFLTPPNRLWGRAFDSL